MNAVRHELVVRRELMDSQELQFYVNGREYRIWIEVGHKYSGMSGDIDWPGATVVCQETVVGQEIWQTSGASTGREERHLQ
jgi:hypothetical protein